MKIKWDKIGYTISGFIIIYLIADYTRDNKFKIIPSTNNFSEHLAMIIVLLVVLYLTVLSLIFLFYLFFVDDESDNNNIY